MDPPPQRGVRPPPKVVRKMLQRSIDNEAEQISSGHREEDTKEGSFRRSCGREGKTISSGESEMRVQEGGSLREG